MFHYLCKGADSRRGALVTEAPASARAAAQCEG